MIKVGFIGAQDTGKTTLAKLVSAKFSSLGFITEYVSEYAREYILRYGKPTSISDQLHITETQFEHEKAIAPNAQIMFTDSPLYIGYVYSTLLTNFNTNKDVDFLAQIHRFVLKNAKYDFLYYLVPYKKPVNDGVRPAEYVAQNSKIDRLICAYLDLHRINYTTIAEPVFDKRANKIIDDLLVSKLLSAIK